MEDHDVLPLVERMDGLVRRVSCDFHRSLCPLVDWSNRLIGVKGARGAGKTTLMRQHVKETEHIYDLYDQCGLQARDVFPQSAALGRS